MESGMGNREWGIDGPQKDRLPISDSRFPTPRPRPLLAVRLENSDEGQVSIGLRVVQAVTDDEVVVDGEPQVVDGDAVVSGDLLFQERADLDGLRIAGC